MLAVNGGSYTCAPTLQRFAAEEVVFNQGDIGDKYYIVLSGSLSVQVTSRWVQSL